MQQKVDSRQAFFPIYIFQNHTKISAFSLVNIITHASFPAHIPKLETIRVVIVQKWGRNFYNHFLE